jgi:hypothetical protein
LFAVLKGISVNKNPTRGKKSGSLLDSGGGRLTRREHWFFNLLARSHRAEGFDLLDLILILLLDYLAAPPPASRARTAAVATCSPVGPARAARW